MSKDENIKKDVKKKPSFKGINLALVALFKIVPFSGFFFAVFMLLSGKAHDIGMGTAGWVAFIATLFAFVLHIYIQKTIPEKGYFAVDKKKLFVRFLLRELEVLASFVVAFPTMGLMVDKLLGLPKFLNYPYTIIGVVVILITTVFLLKILIEFGSKGEGTPVPYEATQNLVTTGPYSYCRNPMEIALISLMGGMALMLGSYFGIFFFLYTIFICVTYTLKFEENEMEDRFGQEWRDYKASVNRWMPRFSKAK